LKRRSYAISESEEKDFRTDGYLLLKSAVSVREVRGLLEEVHRLVLKATKSSTVLREPYYHKNSYKLTRVLRMTSAFDKLIDHPGYFGKLVSLIGTHIQLMGTEIFVRGAAERTITEFHTDLGPGLQNILVTDESRFLQIKAQIFLTDLSLPDASNFALIPGSHRIRVTQSNDLSMVDEINRQISPDGSLPPQAVQILARPGDVLLFPHSLWHAVGPNRIGRTRYSITLRYGQLALRPFERFDPILADHGRKLTARQRRLLGDLGEQGTSPYRPRLQEQVICENFEFSAAAIEADDL
jgi:Phytanoyl-CoA dioxygenase (PhyH)